MISLNGANRRLQNLETVSPDNPDWPTLAEWLAGEIPKAARPVIEARRRSVAETLADFGGAIEK